MFHEEAHYITTFARAEILKDSFGRGNHKRRSLFVGKRAQAFVISPTFFQRHKIRDHLHDIRGFENLIYGLLVNHLVLVLPL